MTFLYFEKILVTHTRKQTSQVLNQKLKRLPVLMSRHFKADTRANTTPFFSITNNVRLCEQSELQSEPFIGRFGKFQLLVVLAGLISIVEIIQVYYLNNLIEQGHCFIKKNTISLKGFNAFHSAKATHDGIETAHMIRLE
jgi:hypothetical protein